MNCQRQKSGNITDKLHTINQEICNICFQFCRMEHHVHLSFFGAKCCICYFQVIRLMFILLSEKSKKNPLLRKAEAISSAFM